MSASFLFFSANFSLNYGLIGIDEYQERIDVALWVYSSEPENEDPRYPPANCEERESYAHECDLDAMQDDVSCSSCPVESIELISFSAFTNWHFIVSDPDPFPSVPHGHFQSKTRPWPKLNPYTGRVFSAKHQENLSSRLSKTQLNTLWSDKLFRDHCRIQLMWYLETFPHYTFPVGNPLRLPRRRRSA